MRGKKNPWETRGVVHSYYLGVICAVLREEEEETDEDASAGFELV